MRGVLGYIFDRLACDKHCYHISKHTSSGRTCCHCGKLQYLVGHTRGVPGHGKYCRDGEKYSEWEDASPYAGL